MDNNLIFKNVYQLILFLILVYCLFLLICPLKSNYLLFHYTLIAIVIIYFIRIWIQYIFYSVFFYDLSSPCYFLHIQPFFILFIFFQKTDMNQTHLIPLFQTHNILILLLYYSLRTNYNPLLFP